MMALILGLPLVDGHSYLGSTPSRYDTCYTLLQDAMHLPMGSESQSEAGSDESPLGSRRQSRMVSYRVRLGRVWW